uniref:Uncharacterized protein n=1 Tax=viral metagenome TaxID=1070528 RepID=A0A2V0RN67_9ZZZZ
MEDRWASLEAKLREEVVAVGAPAGNVGNIHGLADAPQHDELTVEQRARLETITRTAVQTGYTSPYARSHVLQMIKDAESVNAAHVVHYDTLGTLNLRRVTGQRASSFASARFDFLASSLSQSHIIARLGKEIGARYYSNVASGRRQDRDSAISTSLTDIVRYLKRCLARLDVASADPITFRGRSFKSKIDFFAQRTDLVVTLGLMLPIEFGGTATIYQVGEALERGDDKAEGLPSLPKYVHAGAMLTQLRTAEVEISFDWHKENEDHTATATFNAGYTLTTQSAYNMGVGTQSTELLTDEGRKGTWLTLMVPNGTLDTIPARIVTARYGMPVSAPAGSLANAIDRASHATWLDGGYAIVTVRLSTGGSYFTSVNNFMQYDTGNGATPTHGSCFVSTLRMFCTPRLQMDARPVVPRIHNLLNDDGMTRRVTVFTYSGTATLDAPLFMDTYGLEFARGLITLLGKASGGKVRHKAMLTLSSKLGLQMPKYADAHIDFLRSVIVMLAPVLERLTAFFRDHNPYRVVGELTLEEIEEQLYARPTIEFADAAIDALRRGRSAAYRWLTDDTNIVAALCTAWCTVNSATALIWYFQYIGFQLSPCLYPHSYDKKPETGVKALEEILKLSYSQWVPPDSLNPDRGQVSLQLLLSLCRSDGPVFKKLGICKELFKTSPSFGPQVEHGGP